MTSSDIIHRPGRLIDLSDDDIITIYYDDGTYQLIAASPGDHDRIRAGADPVLDLWEDEAGTPVGPTHGIAPIDDDGDRIGPSYTWMVWMDTICRRDIISAPYGLPNGLIPSHVILEHLMRKLDAVQRDRHRPRVVSMWAELEREDADGLQVLDCVSVRACDSVADIAPALYHDMIGSILSLRSRLGRDPSADDLMRALGPESPVVCEHRSSWDDTDGDDGRLHISEHDIDDLIRDVCEDCIDLYAEGFGL